MSNSNVKSLGIDHIKDIVSDILQLAVKKGATSAEVDAGVSQGFSITARNMEVESIEYAQDKGMSITVYLGKRSGSVSISDLRMSSIQSAVDAACSIAKYTDEDPCAGLAEKSELAFDYSQLDGPYPWELSVDKGIEMLCECEKIALEKDKRITTSENAVLSTALTYSVYGNTHGFIGLDSSSRHEMSCVLIAKQDEDMQRDYYYTTASTPDMLDSIYTIAENAVERTVRRLGARRLSTRRAPVIFLAEEARSLIGHFVSAISGGNLYRKSSFLLDHLGQQIFPDFIKIQEHPHLPRALGSSAFDDNGVATRDNIFIEKGILKNYVLGVYSARQLGMKTTGNAGGVHNLTISSGECDLSALLKKMGTGLLVTELMGQGVNIITGDYSRGAAGFWVENGIIQYPVEEITIAGNLKTMYLNLVDVGTDIDKRGNIHTGSILIEEMIIAGD